MKLLLDTHLLLWSSSTDEAIGRSQLSSETQDIINAPDADLIFSAASIWEIAIKSSRHTGSFAIDPAIFRGRLIARGLGELFITGVHAAAVHNLPWVHKDPFDRLLIAQAMVEGATLLTSDETVAAYPGPIRLI